jgi:hypothetical protein
MTCLIETLSDLQTDFPVGSMVKLFGGSDHVGKVTRHRFTCGVPEAFVVLDHENGGGRWVFPNDVVLLQRAVGVFERRADLLQSMHHR